MTDRATDILHLLAHAICHDAEKGWGGWRSTADIADRLAIKTAAARRALNRLLDVGLVDWDGPIGGLGNVYFWRLAEPDDGNGEPVPCPANDNAAAARVAA